MILVLIFMFVIASFRCTLNRIFLLTVLLVMLMSRIQLHILLSDLVYSVSLKT